MKFLTFRTFFILLLWDLPLLLYQFEFPIYNRFKVIFYLPSLLSKKTAFKYMNKINKQNFKSIYNHSITLIIKIIKQNCKLFCSIFLIFIVSAQLISFRVQPILKVSISAFSAVIAIVADYLFIKFLLILIFNNHPKISLLFFLIVHWIFIVISKLNKIYING